MDRVRAIQSLIPTLMEKDKSNLFNVQPLLQPEVIFTRRRKI